VNWVEVHALADKFPCWLPAKEPHGAASEIACILRTGSAIREEAEGLKQRKERRKLAKEPHGAASKISCIVRTAPAKDDELANVCSQDSEDQPGAIRVPGLNGNLDEDEEIIANTNARVDEEFVSGSQWPSDSTASLSVD
jgi:hypothetical protein